MIDLLLFVLGMVATLGIFDLIALKWGVDSAAWDRDSYRRVALM
jgi:hypothetical protein